MIVAILFFLLHTMPQAQMSSGDIKGIVTDSSNSVIVGAKVTVTNLETGVTRTVTSDSTGAYRFFVLPPANYELRVDVQGFAIYTRRPLPVTIGQTVIADAQLQPRSIQQEVVVQTEVPLVEPEKVQQSDTITETRIDNLPINERNFLNFSLLTPGVTDSNGLVTFTLPQTATSGLSFLGQGGRSNNISIDGVDNNDDAVAGVRSTMSQEAVQEFQINRSNYSAEFGRASGGLINIVSKSGSNAMHGNAFGFFRHEKLDARNPFAFGPGNSDIDPPYSRQQAGFTLGGPLKKDRTFYFLSYEGLRQRQSQFVSFLENTQFFQPTTSQRALITAFGSAPSAQFQSISAQLNAYLTTSPQVFPGTVSALQSNSGVFPYKNNNNTASLRLDHSLSASNQLLARLTFTDIDTFGGSFGGLKGPSRGTNNQIQDSALVVGDTHFFNSRFVNEFRFQFADRDYGARSEDPYGPEIDINGIAQIGRDFFLPSVRNEKRFQWLDNVTLVKGKHELKVGGDFNYIPLNTTTEVFLGGRFIFGGSRPLRAGTTCPADIFTSCSNIVPPGPGEVVPLGLVIDSLLGPGSAQQLGTALAAPPPNGLGRADLVPNLSDPITSLQAFNFGLPLLYQQGFGNPVAELTNKEMSAYFQDNFKASSHLTLNLGLRYDMEFQPSPVHRDKNNFAPRLGFSYSPDNRTVIRGGYGVYYAPVFEAVAFIARVLDGSQVSQLVVPLTGIPQLGITATSAQVWGIAKNLAGKRTLTLADLAPLKLSPGTTPSVVLRTAPDLRNPYSQQMSFGVDREIPGSVTVSASYLGNHGSKILRSRNVNLQQNGTNVYGPTFGAIDPHYVQINQVESSAGSVYHGLALSATKHFGERYQFQTAYTFSKAIDDVTDFITDLQPANQLNIRGERSLSSFDQRHRLVIDGVARTWGDITIAPIMTVGSGHPFNLLLGFDANRDTNSNTDRPLGAGRNTGKGPDFINFDLRVAKEVRFGPDRNYSVQGIAEAFNLFNRVNFSGINNIVGNATFATYRVKGRRDADPTDPLAFTSAFDPRQIQLGFKFRW